MGLVNRNGIYYAEFYDSSRTPKAKRFSLRTKRKKTAAAAYRRLESDYESGSFDPWEDAPDTYLEKGSSTDQGLKAADLVNSFLHSRERLAQPLGNNYVILLLAVNA